MINQATKRLWVESTGSLIHRYMCISYYILLLYYLLFICYIYYEYTNTKLAIDVVLVDIYNR